jgi:hypothetical protein
MSELMPVMTKVQEVFCWRPSLAKKHRCSRAARSFALLLLPHWQLIYATSPGASNALISPTRAPR